MAILKQAVDIIISMMAAIREFADHPIYHLLVSSRVKVTNIEDDSKYRIPLNALGPLYDNFAWLDASIKTFYSIRLETEEIMEALENIDRTHVIEFEHRIFHTPNHYKILYSDNSSISVTMSDTDKVLCEIVMRTGDALLSAYISPDIILNL